MRRDYAINNNRGLISGSTRHDPLQAAILAMLASGFSTAKTVPIQNIALLRAHILLGATVAILTAFRIVWWLIIDTNPAPLKTEKGYARAAAHFVHIAFYVIIIAMVISGTRLFFKFELWGVFGEGIPQVYIRAKPPGIRSLEIEDASVTLDIVLAWHDDNLSPLAAHFVDVATASIASQETPCQPSPRASKNREAHQAASARPKARRR